MPELPARFNLAALKGAVTRALPPGHPMRTVVMELPDHMEGPEAAAKIEMLFRLMDASDPCRRSA